MASSSTPAASSSGSASRWSPRADSARPSTAPPRLAVPARASRRARRAARRRRMPAPAPRQRPPGQVAGRGPGRRGPRPSRRADHGVAQRQRVDRVGRQPEPVAARRCADHVGRGLRAGARDHDLQRLGRVGGHVVRSPDLVDEPFLGDLAARGPRSAASSAWVRPPGSGVPCQDTSSSSREIHGSQRWTAPQRSAASGDRGVAGGAGLLLGQGAVGRPEAQREGQRLLARADLRRRCRRRRAGSTRAARRRPRAARPRPRRRARRRPRRGRRPPWPPGRSRSPAPGATSTARAIRKSRSISTAAVRGGQAERRAHPRVQLAGVAELDSADADLRRSGPGATASGSADAHLDLDAQLVAERADQLDRVRPVGRSRPAPHQPARSRSPARTTAEVQRLLGERLEQLVQLGLGRPPVDAVDRAPGRGRPGSATVPVSNSATPGRAAAEVARGRAEQAGQQRRGVRRLLGRQRVGQPDASWRSASSAGSPSASKVGRRRRTGS